MRAMLLDAPRRPLRSADVPRPEPGPGQVLVAVEACGVCRTDLHVAHGELPDPKLPLVLGHEIVGTVAAVGAGADVAVGDRIGVPWRGGRTCATAPASPATSSTAATPSTPSRTPATPSRSRPPILTPRPRRSCAPDSLATARLSPRGTESGSVSTASGPRPTSWPRWPATRGAASSLSHAPET